MNTERQSPFLLADRVHPLAVNGQTWGFFKDGIECRRAEQLVLIADAIRLAVMADPELRRQDTLEAIAEILRPHTQNSLSAINLPINTEGKR